MEPSHAHVGSRLPDGRERDQGRAQIEPELIAARLSLDEIRDYVGADSLAYLSIGGVLEALELPREQFCFACFDGQYAVPVPYDVAAHKFILEEPQDEPLAGVR